MLIRILKRLLLWCGDDSYQRQTARIKEADVLNDALLKKAAGLVEERDIKSAALDHAELRIKRLLTELSEMDEAAQKQESIIRSMGSKQRDLEAQVYELERRGSRYRALNGKSTTTEQKIAISSVAIGPVFPPSNNDSYSRNACRRCGYFQPYCRCS
ncbi:hypothetical protein ACQXXB_09625 [Aeromonas veronii]|uniref:hypothetical protein n=1 Tax=Aeromonas veronii TaxID=654 RepID=UPI003D241534